MRARGWLPKLPLSGVSESNTQKLPARRPWGGPGAGLSLAQRLTRPGLGVQGDQLAQSQLGSAARPPPRTAPVGSCSMRAAAGNARGVSARASFFFVLFPSCR